MMSWWWWLGYLIVALLMRLTMTTATFFTINLVLQLILEPLLVHLHETPHRVGRGGTRTFE
jgi:hypothetical protein